MPITFLQTADWQLGKPFARVSDAPKRSRLQNESFECFKRVAAVAKEHTAAFVLVAGDQFDSPSPLNATVTKACEAIGAMEVPVLVIPGTCTPADYRDIRLSRPLCGCVPAPQINPCPSKPGKSTDALAAAATLTGHHETAFLSALRALDGTFSNLALWTNPGCDEPTDLATMDALIAPQPHHSGQRTRRQFAPCDFPRLNLNLYHNLTIIATMPNQLGRIPPPHATIAPTNEPK